MVRMIKLNQSTNQCASRVRKLDHQKNIVPSSIGPSLPLPSVLSDSRTTSSISKLDTDTLSAVVSFLFDFLGCKSGKFSRWNQCMERKAGGCGTEKSAWMPWFFRYLCGVFRDRTTFFAATAASPSNLKPKLRSIQWWRFAVTWLLSRASRW